MQFESVISSSIALIAAVITIIPIIIALFGYFRIREIENTKQLLNEAVTESVRKRLRIAIRKLEKEFSKDLVSKTMESVHTEFGAEGSSRILLMDTVKAFVTNYGNADRTLSLSDFQKITAFRNDLERLSSSKEDEVLLSIKQLRREAKNWSRTPCLFVLKYLIALDQKNSFTNFQIQFSCQDLIEFLCQKTGVKLNDLEG